MKLYIDYSCSISQILLSQEEQILVRKSRNKFQETITLSESLEGCTVLILPVISSLIYCKYPCNVENGSVTMQHKLLSSNKLKPVRVDCNSRTVDLLMSPVPIVSDLAHQQSAITSIASMFVQFLLLYPYVSLLTCLFKKNVANTHEESRSVVPHLYFRKQSLGASMIMHCSLCETSSFVFQYKEI